MSERAPSGRFPFPPHARPRRVPGGIRASSRRGAIGRTWWSQRFITILESFEYGHRLARGRTYARQGQVLDLEVRAGEVRARVQGSRVRPYQVLIAVPAFAEREWRRVERALASSALFAARLLAGEMPPDVEEAFAGCGLSLFPSAGRELASSCSCPDVMVPCKHVAAAFYILAEAFDADPFLIFAWRGRGRDQLIERLRALRGATAGAEAGGGGDGRELAVGEGAQAGTPLEAELDRFWEPGPELEQVSVRPTAATPEALVRQLGPPPPGAGLSQLWRLLPAAYAAIASEAERRALERDGRGGGGGR